MSDLTEVELYWHQGRVERWIRFGFITSERIIDRRRRLVGFSPGSIFAYVRWAANEHGTIASRIDILRAAPPGAAISTVPGVQPGGEILLRLAGWPKVQKVLSAIDAVEALGIDPKDVSQDYWRHLHNRIFVGRTRALMAALATGLGSFDGQSKHERTVCGLGRDACGRDAYSSSGCCRFFTRFYP